MGWFLKEKWKEHSCFDRGAPPRQAYLPFRFGWQADAPIALFFSRAFNCSMNLCISSHDTVSTGSASGLRRKLCSTLSLPPPDREK